MSTCWEGKRSEVVVLEDGVIVWLEGSAVGGGCQCLSWHHKGLTCKTTCRVLGSDLKTSYSISQAGTEQRTAAAIRNRKALRHCPRCSLCTAADQRSDQPRHWPGPGAPALHLHALILHLGRPSSPFTKASSCSIRRWAGPPADSAHITCFFLTICQPVPASNNSNFCSQFWIVNKCGAARVPRHMTLACFCFCFWICILFFKCGFLLSVSCDLVQLNLNSDSEWVSAFPSCDSFLVVEHQADSSKHTQGTC